MGNLMKQENGSEITSSIKGRRDRERVTRIVKKAAQFLVEKREQQAVYRLIYLDMLLYPKIIARSK